LGTQVTHTLSPMGQRALERKLHKASARLKDLREELRVVDDQLAALADDADELALRALVSETPAAGFEHRHAQAHVDAMRRARAKLAQSIADVEADLDDLLDQLKVQPS